MHLSYEVKKQWTVFFFGLFVWLRWKGYYQYLLCSSIIKKVKGNIKHIAVRKKGHRNINTADKECAERLQL